MQEQEQRAKGSVTIVLPGCHEAALYAAPFTVTSREAGCAEVYDVANTVLHLLMQSVTCMVLLCISLFLLQSVVAEANEEEFQAQSRLKERDEEALYQALVNLRACILHEMEGAKRQGPLSTHHVFVDTVLRDIARQVPSNIEEFAKIGGVGRH